MTADPAVLRTISDAWETLTPDVIDAKTAALNTKVGARLAFWQSAAETVAGLTTQIAADSTALAAANTAITTAQAQATARTATIASLNASIASLQEQIAEGGPPASATDIAHRDQVNALLTELGIAIP
jgi:capsule polysaccharide export protein KpsE/RkpR